MTEKDTPNQAESTGPHRVELGQWVELAPYEKLLQMKIISAADGQARLTMPFLQQFAQGAGLMHGGALISLADTAMAMAVKTRLSEGTRFGTRELQVRFLRPVLAGVVEANARVVSHRGRDLEVSIDIIGEDGEPVFAAQGLFRVARTQTG